MRLPIIPYTGAGGVKLGFSRAEIRRLIGGEYREFLKTPDSELLTDDFIGKGIHIYYKAPGICEAIELHPPSDPTFRGQQLINMPFHAICELMQAADPSVEIDDCGLTSPLFGINLYVPDLDEGPGALVKAVIVFEKGYYG